MCLSLGGGSTPAAPPPPPPLPPPPPQPAPPPKPAPAPQSLQQSGSSPDVRTSQKKKDTGRQQTNVSKSSLRSTLNIGGSSNAGGINS